MSKRRKARWQAKKVHLDVSGLQPGMFVWVILPLYSGYGHLLRCEHGERGAPVGWAGWNWLVKFTKGGTIWCHENELSKVA